MVLETTAGLNVESIGAALARRNFHMVLAAGGDGTVAEVMAAAHERGIPMGIVPLGTANIVARELGLPAGWRRATQRALERFPATRAVDLARVNDGYMALAAGIGFDAMVMRHTPPFRFGPNIAIDDGWLDVCIYRPRTVLDRASLLWSIVRRRADGERMVQRKARSVEIKAPDVHWHEVDGEVFRGNVLRAEIVAGGVSVVV